MRKTKNIQIVRKTNKLGTSHIKSYTLKDILLLLSWFTDPLVGSLGALGALVASCWTHRSPVARRAFAGSASCFQLSSLLLPFYWASARKEFALETQRTGPHQGHPVQYCDLRGSGEASQIFPAQRMSRFQTMQYARLLILSVRLSTPPSDSSCFYYFDAGGAGAGVGFPRLHDF